MPRSGDELESMMGNAATDILNGPDLGPDRSPKLLIAKGTGTSSQAAHDAADAVGIIREWGSVYTLTATRCCVCGTALRDAVSVTRGIGPVCGRTHYDIPVDITTAMMEEALGLLQASDLDSLVKRAAKSLKTKPRDLCNILVWWASAHLDETKTVLGCAEIVTALGFVSLGDRLRERNTDVIISHDPSDGDYFVLRCRSRYNVRRNMRAVKEATSVPREGRFAYGWRFPATRKSLVWTILGEDFGGQFVTVPGKCPGNPSKVTLLGSTRWFDVRAAFRAAYDPKLPKEAIVRIVKDAVTGCDTIQVYTPYRSFGFVGALKDQVPYRQRTWNRKDACWTVFSMKYETKVRALVADHFNSA